MRRLKVKRFTLSIFCLLCVAASLMAAPTVIRAGADAWDPYTMDPAKGQAGYLVDIMKEVFAEPGFALEYKLIPFVRATQAVSDRGELDVYPGVFSFYGGFIMNKARVGVSDMRIVVRKGEDWRYAGANSFKGRKIGFAQTEPDMLTRMLSAPAPAATATVFSQAVYAAATAYSGGDTMALQVVSGDDMTAKLIQMLVAGRFDLFMEDRTVVTYLAKKLGLQDKIEFREAAVPPMDVFLGFSPKNPASKDLADRFDRGLKELRASGKLKLILGRYGLSDWE